MNVLTTSDRSYVKVFDLKGCKTVHVPLTLVAFGYGVTGVDSLDCC